jgi:hypothetical protein
MTELMILLFYFIGFTEVLALGSFIFEVLPNLVNRRSRSRY